MRSLCFSSATLTVVLVISVGLPIGLVPVIHFCLKICQLARVRFHLGADGRSVILGRLSEVTGQSVHYLNVMEFPRNVLSKEGAYKNEI